MDSGIKYIEFEKKKTYIRPTCTKPNTSTGKHGRPLYIEKRN